MAYLHLEKYSNGHFPIQTIINAKIPMYPLFILFTFKVVNEFMYSFPSSKTQLASVKLLTHEYSVVIENNEIIKKKFLRRIKKNKN